MASPTFTDENEAILALEAPLRFLASRLAEDEVKAILTECLADVFEHDD